MTARDSQQTGRLRLRHLREKTEAIDEEMAAERPRFERLAKADARPRVVSADQLFQTPEPLAARMASMFTTFGRTLEPSAGLGRLYSAVRARSADCPITLIEQAPQCAGELYRATEGDANAKLIQADFFEAKPSELGQFDSILMNPPFRQGIDCKHIAHALQFLKPDALLVALCYNGPRQKAKLKPLAETWEELPAGLFDGTKTSAVLLTIRGNTSGSY